MPHVGPLQYCVTFCRCYSAAEADTQQTQLGPDDVEVTAAIGSVHHQNKLRVS